MAETNTAKAVPSDGGGDGTKVGVGISVAVNYAEAHTLAQIANGVSLLGDCRSGSKFRNLTMSATSEQDMTTEAKSGGKGSTDRRRSVMGSVAVTSNDTEATIGSGATLLLSGAASATASLTDEVGNTAEGDVESDSTGVGISIAVTVVNDNALATTNRDLFTDGAMTFSATAISGSDSSATAGAKGGEQDDGSGSHSDDGKSQSVDNTTQKQSDFGDKTAKDSGGSKGTGGAKTDKGSTSDGGVSVAGAVAVNIQNASAQAYIPTLRSITAAGGMLTLKSSTNVDGQAIATGAASTSGSGTGVGVAVSVNVANNTNLAYNAGGATVSAGGLDVEAGMAERDIQGDTSHDDPGGLARHRDHRQGHDLRRHEHRLAHRRRREIQRRRRHRDQRADRRHDVLRQGARWRPGAVMRHR